MTDDRLAGLRQMVADLGGLGADEIDPNEPLFTAGLIDSMSLLQVISFVEEKFGVEVNPADITLDNWDSLSRIGRFLTARGVL